jgi:hypothetical protein
MLGIWALPHFQGMLLVPPSTGHKVVFTGCILATIGGFAAVTWVVIERNWLSWMALGVSCWMFLVWMVMMLGD